MKKSRITLILLGVLLIGVIIFTNQKQDYEVKEITTNSLDEEFVAVKIQNDSNTYEKTSTIPLNGYILNEEESYCGIKQGDGTYSKEEVAITYKSGKVIIDKVNKYGMKCFLYFDKAPCIGVACETILANNSVDMSRISGEFTGTFEEDTAGRIFKGPEDDYGETTYFFAGANPNNWVKFAGFYWRIIRINGNGTIRMIYNGTAMDQTGVGTLISNDGGTTTYYKFNSMQNDNAYVGYMYGTPGSDNYNVTHANVNDSTVKTEVDTWYNTNLNKEEYTKYIDINAGFCGDRKISTVSISGYGTQATAYAAVDRLMDSSWNALSTQKPTLKCSQNNDLYTSKSANRGNKALDYPVGLITSDEVVFAGGFRGSQNRNYWLYTNQWYWTMSPAYYYSTISAHMFIVDDNGHISTPSVNDNDGIRPVINLRADTKLTGSGTTSDPFVVS